MRTRLYRLHEVSRIRVCLLNACPRSRSPASSRRFGAVTRARRAGPRGRRRARCTASSGPTARASRPRSACCSGCCAPTRARRALLGGDPWRDATALHRRLAYVPGDVTLWPNLSRRRGDRPARPPARRARRAAPRATLLERFELDPTKKGRAYSKGNRQKVALVAALASDVELLILDEPTSGPGPADGGGLPRVRRRRARARAAPSCSPATSCPRSRRCATA